jgi:hypothetical protein
MSLVFCFAASQAAMHPRAESNARSLPHLSEVPTRTAEQNVEISFSVADSRSASLKLQRPIARCSDVRVMLLLFCDCADGVTRDQKTRRILLYNRTLLIS